MTLIEALSEVEDPRRAQGLRTDLEQIFYMTVIGYLCGYTGYRELKFFCDSQADIFIETLSLRHGIPSHVTFWQVLTNVEDQGMVKAFNKWSGGHVPLEKRSFVSGDGKVLGSTVTDANGKKQDFQAIVSLFSQESGLVYSLADYRNKAKETGEGSVARFLIGELTGMGVIFTLDALHTQKKRSAKSQKVETTI